MTNEDWTAEADLAARLTADLGALDVGAAPVGSVLGWGTAIKTRRRAVRVSVLSVVAVAGVALPFALRSRPAAVPPPWTNHPATAHHTVTVDPPHSAADGAPVWSGSIDGVRWSMQAGAVVPLSICIDSIRFPCFTPLPDEQIAGPADANPVLSRTDDDTFIIELQPAVTGADVYLDDGTDLHLQPAVYEGHRIAIFRLPRGYPVDRVVAHLPSGDQASVALNRPGKAATWGVWYPAGAVPDVPTASGVVVPRSGRDPFQTADVTAYVGPFGVYIDTGGMVSFGLSTPEPRTGLEIRSDLDIIPIDHSSRWDANQVSEAVDHIVLEYPDGTRTVLRPVVIGGIRFVAAFLTPDRLPLRAVSYDAAGTVIAVSDANHTAGAAGTSSTP